MLNKRRWLELIPRWVASAALFLGLSTVSFSASAPLSASVNVADTLTLNLGTSSVTFKTITYANLNQPDTQPLNQVQAYSTNTVPITILMTSTTPADASGNPQMKDSNNPPGYIPYSVSFQPCYVESGPQAQPKPSMYSLKLNVPQTIPKPYSQSLSCFVPAGGRVLGVMNFSRLPLALMPSTGTYANTLTFTIAEA